MTFVGESVTHLVLSRSQCVRATVEMRVFGCVRHASSKRVAMMCMRVYSHLNPADTCKERNGAFVAVDASAIVGYIGSLYVTPRTPLISRRAEARCRSACRICTSGLMQFVA